MDKDYNRIILPKSLDKGTSYRTAVWVANSIFTSRAMRERGRYQIQLMKTRSSSGVGSKVDLEFDVDSLRIRDLADDPEYKQFDKQRSTIYDSLKQKSKVSADKTDAQPKVPDPTKGDDIGKVKATVEGGKLRQLLNELHSDEEQ